MLYTFAHQGILVNRHASRADNPPAMDWEAFELLFRMRLEDGNIKISRALEDNFVEPTNPVAQ
jgi:hypothetical protein